MDNMNELPFTRRQALAGAAVLALLLLLGGRVFARSGTATSAAPLPAPPVAASTASAPKQVVVDVAGAVRRPGLYRLTTGARVADAIRRAGGTTRHADVSLVNLAQLVADGEQVVVPRRGDAVTAAGAPSLAGGAPATGPVHLNSATVDQLDALPGVGPVTAQKIVDYRTKHGGFSSVDALDAIPGIGPARLDQLRGLVAP
jgi:competence protein ComEA